MTAVHRSVAATHDRINRLVLDAHPDAQAVYCYGTWGTASERPDPRRERSGSIAMTDVLIAKQQTLERCLARVRHAWQRPSTLPFDQDYDRQDIIALNLQRACEQGVHDKKVGDFAVGGIGRALIDRLLG